MKNQMIYMRCFLFTFLLFFFTNFLYTHEKQEEKTVLIIGCAKNGTRYISKVLQQSTSLKVGHEVILKNGVVSWMMTFDTPLVPYGYARNGRKFKHIFHQVRHPLKEISSIYAVETPYSWEYIHRLIPKISPHEDRLVQCAKYWYYWNKYAEKQAELTYRVEDLETIKNEFKNRLNITFDEDILYAPPKNINIRHPIKNYRTWNDLKIILPNNLYRKICKLAIKYCYNKEPEMELNN